MSTPSDRPPDRRETGSQPPSDPFELWRQIYAANERAWNAAIERSLGNPAYAEAQGKLLETFLNVQKTFREQMRTYLEAVNVPSREDIARLGELIVGLEEKVDQVADRLLDLETAVQHLSAAAEWAAQPPSAATVSARTGSRSRRSPASEPPTPSVSEAPASFVAEPAAVEPAPPTRRRAARTVAAPRRGPRPET